MTRNPKERRVMAESRDRQRRKKVRSGMYVYVLLDLDLIMRYAFNRSFMRPMNVMRLRQIKKITRRAIWFVTDLFIRVSYYMHMTLNQAKFEIR
jgi:hypothetical protein